MCVCVCVGALYTVKKVCVCLLCGTYKISQSSLNFCPSARNCCCEFGLNLANQAMLCTLLLFFLYEMWMPWDSKVNEDVRREGEGCKGSEKSSQIVCVKVDSGGDGVCCSFCCTANVASFLYADTHTHVHTCSNTHAHTHTYRERKRKREKEWEREITP